MSLVHPWANRLSGWTYTACGTTVRLPISRRLHTDQWGLPLNGVHSVGDAWRLEGIRGGAESAAVEASLHFDADPGQLAVFPFPHRLRLSAELTQCSLRLDFKLEPTADVPVPVCFGYRIYLRRAPLADATLLLPARRRLATDERLLPTGRLESRQMGAYPVVVDELHEVFSLGSDRRVTVAGPRRRITAEFLGGFPFGQVCSVAGQPHLMVEALTAPPDALNRDAFPVATSMRPYRASLRVSID
jgi:aldose 1-epimerase